MRYFFIAGEASGDMHASCIIKELKRWDTQAEFKGTGGKRMQEAGVQIALHIREMAFMGFVEVLKNIFRIFSNFSTVKKAIKTFNPDVIVLVDYPGFNLRMARWAKKNGYRVVYYIAPKVWAWNLKRVSQIKRYVDLLLVIFPFEKAFFSDYGIRTVYVGNPLIQRIPEENPMIPQDQVALLPGSRIQEIKRMLPIMLATFRNQNRKEKLVVAGMSDFGEQFYIDMIGNEAILEMDNTYQVLRNSKYALVTSGTASLEAALLNIPQIVCYSTSFLTYWIAKTVMKVRFISLVNLILNKRVVTELIQKDFNPLKIKMAIKELEQDSKLLKDDYLRLRKVLGGKQASSNVAREIFEWMEKGN